MKIGVIGCAGRMGQNLVRLIEADDGLILAGASERLGSEFVGREIGGGIVVTDNAEEVIAASDAIIDFTSPESTLACAEATVRLKKIHIIGTTGVSAEQENKLAEYAKETVIVKASNFSIGVNILQGLVEKTAALVGPKDYDIEILEMHHKHKVDAPSGTALMLGNAAALGRGVQLDDVACYAREGQTGARPEGEIGFATLRGGGVVGDHTAIFASDGELIELTHKAGDRSVFAAGALRAAGWAKGQKAGRVYTMQDVLGF